MARGETERDLALKDEQSASERRQLLERLEDAEGSEREAKLALERLQEQHVQQLQLQLEQQEQNQQTALKIVTVESLQVTETLATSLEAVSGDLGEERRKKMDAALRRQRKEEAILAALHAATANAEASKQFDERRLHLAQAMWRHQQAAREAEETAARTRAQTRWDG